MHCKNAWLKQPKRVVILVAFFQRPRLAKIYAVTLF